MKIRVSSEFDFPASTLRDLKRLGLDRDAALLEWIGCAPMRQAIDEEEPLKGRVELAAEFRMGFSVQVLGEEEEAT